MPKSGDKKPAGSDQAGAGPEESIWAGVGKGTRSPTSTESVPQPDQTRSLDFTSLAGGAARTGAPGGPAGQRSAVEEAAVLYAGGEAARAKALLERVVDASPARAWLMLLELHQALGEHAEFAARAGAFKARFSRAAPDWRPPAPADAGLRTGGGAYVGLRGRLSAQSASQLEQVRAAAQQHRLLRIDLSRLQGADGPGCGLLLDMLRAIRRGGAEAVLTGEQELLGALTRATRPGDRQADRAFWLLRLEILQGQGRRAEFEGVAHQYAQTYVESAPRYEVPGAARPPAAAVPVPGGVGVLRAPAEIVDNPDAFFGAIAAAAASRADVVIDCSGLQRIDVPSAQTLRNVAAKLEEHGKRLELRQPNALVVALLEVTGVSALATVVPRH